jgi:polyphosphate kinase
MLEGFLRKVGVGSYDQLTEEEKKTYREYEEILNGRRITDEDVRLFFNQQLEQTTEKLLSTKLDTREDTFLKMKLEFLRNITSFLDAPEREKKQLQNLINS